MTENYLSTEGTLLLPNVCHPANSRTAMNSSRLVLKIAFGLIFTMVFCSVLHAREDLRLDSDWRFKLGDSPAASSMDCDDHDWQIVSLPHNWGWEEAQAGKPYYRGPGWYRRELHIKPEPEKRYFIRFEAASLVADVYLNGKSLGQHRGGFGAFCFEITSALSSGGTNVLAVGVNNARVPDLAPLDGDFSVYGGLYRPVHLIVTSDTDFALMDHGSSGVAWVQTNVSSTQAVINVTAQISNGSKTKKTLKWVAKILDANSNLVTSNTQAITLTAHETAPYFTEAVLSQPHLWNGRKDPYLYRAIVELRTTDDVLLDSVEQPLGLRFYHVDPAKGFYLNGEPYHLHGVNRHQDFMDKGWAISESDMEQDVALLKEIGATVVRCAHYQHSDYFYSLCDRAGMLVWAELPQVNIIRNTPEFESSAHGQLLDLIRQNRNHPSIFAWSLGNEIGSSSDDPHRELQDLVAVAHGEDPSRPTIEATMTSARPEMNKIPDLLGWNIYPGWYRGAKEDYGRELDSRRESSRYGGYCVSEYGAGANVLHHEQNARSPQPAGQWHPEEWQAEVHEAAWAALKQRPFVWGTFVWCMFDFAVSSRHEGGTPGLNDKGLVTRDRQIKKDAFYFYKANWSDEPTLYITSRRFIERTNAVTDVKIYSNATEPELFINGVSQGKNKSGTNGVFVWNNLRLSAGKNSISAAAEYKGQHLVDQCEWVLETSSAK